MQFPISQLGKLRAAGAYTIPVPLHFTFLVKPILENGASFSQASLHLAEHTGLASKHSTSSSSSDSDLPCGLEHRLLSVPHFPRL